MIEHQPSPTPPVAERERRLLAELARLERTVRRLGRLMAEADVRLGTLAEGGRKEPERGPAVGRAPWSRVEVAEFKRVYGSRTDGELARLFGRSREDVAALARTLMLSKDKAFVSRIRGPHATRMPRWRAEELELLKQRYPTEPNLEIARELQRSVPSVVAMAQRLHLRKTPDRLKAMGRENVSVRYAET